MLTKRAKREKYRPFSGGYVSDFEQFLNGYLEQHPDIPEDQQRGWYIWWDHRLDLDELEKQRKSEIPVKPYTYD